MFNIIGKRYIFFFISGCTTIPKQYVYYFVNYRETREKVFYDRLTYELKGKKAVLLNVNHLSDLRWKALYQPIMEKEDK